MSATTPGTRRDYRHFPSEYADMIRTFERETRRPDYLTSPFRLGPFTAKAATASKRDLYRFRLYLSYALDDDPGDDYARSLFTVFNSVTLRTVTEPDGTYISFEINPVVAAMRRLQAGANTL
jgi:hypothetical protein